MEKFLKILKWIIDVLKLYFDSRSAHEKYDSELCKEEKENIKQLNKDIDECHDAIESGNDDKLNEILR